METSQLICSANQLTGFYMRATPVFHGLSLKEKISNSFPLVKKIASPNLYFLKQFLVALSTIALFGN